MKIGNHNKGNNEWEDAQDNISSYDDAENDMDESEEQELKPQAARKASKIKLSKAGRKMARLQNHVGRGKYFGIIARIAIGVLLILWVVWSQNNLLTTKKYLFTSEHVPKTFVGYKIVHVSDIHNSGLDIVKKVKKEKPNAIVITGGLLDDNLKYNNSIKTINKLAKIADTYLTLGCTDNLKEAELLEQLSDDIILVNKYSQEIKSPEIEIDEFIKKYVGKKTMKEAEDGDEEASEYIEYTKYKLEEDKDRVLRISGLNSYTVGKDIDNEKALNSDGGIYGVIGTNKDDFQVYITSQSNLFKELQMTDIDIVFSGGTHGFKSNRLDSLGEGVTIEHNYRKGSYAENGTTMFVNRGVGNLEAYGKRIFNYPQIVSVILSDGTIKEENPLEKFLSNWFSDVETRFDNDGGFKTYKIRYENGKEIRE